MYILSFLDTEMKQVIHCNDVIMSAISFQITGVSIACSTVGSGADQRKHQSSASLAFVWGIHRWQVNSPHTRPVTRKMFPFDDVIMWCETLLSRILNIMADDALAMQAANAFIATLASLSRNILIYVSLHNIIPHHDNAYLCWEILRVNMNIQIYAWTLVNPAFSISHIAIGKTHRLIELWTSQ